MLLKLRDNHLFAEMDKCEFEVENVSFLGYKISSEGFSMDPAKVQAIQDWKLPNNLKAVQRILGLANYYRRFTRSFSSIAIVLKLWVMTP